MVITGHCQMAICKKIQGPSINGHWTSPAARWSLDGWRIALKPWSIKLLELLVTSTETICVACFTDVVNSQVIFYCSRCEVSFFHHNFKWQNHWKLTTEYWKEVRLHAWHGVVCRVTHGGMGDMGSSWGPVEG